MSRSRCALGETPHGIGHGGLVFADHQVAGELGKPPVDPLDRAQEGLVGEQEATVAIGQRESQRQRREERLELRDRGLAAAFPAAADSHRTVDQHH